MTPQLTTECWDKSIYFMEQPNFNPSMAMYCHTNKYMADKGIVITMAGDMGDELMCGYPKYQKLFFANNKPSTWKELLAVWMNRLKRPKNFATNVIPDEELINELEKCYPDELWNADDPVGSYMALDCVTQCPAEFFSRNDTYGMAYSMEGRFPLATKKFMRYCLGMHTDIKIGVKKTSTKILAKRAYQGILPEGITKKAKTGWTVPIGLWLSNNVNQSLSKFYTDSMGRGSVVPASAKSGKGMVPVWQLQSWKQKFNMEF